MESGTLTRRLSSWVSSIANSGSALRLPYIRVRAYGGWYNEAQTSEDRFRAISYYQENCPAVVSAAGLTCHVTFEFADTLIEAESLEYNRVSGVGITHTVARRGAPVSYRLMPAFATCNELSCQLAEARRAMKRKLACPSVNCQSEFSSKFVRLEQKQVDTHITVDLLLAAERKSTQLHLGLWSDDWDMLPGLLATSSRLGNIGSLSSVRTTTWTTYLDRELKRRGVQILAS